MAEFLLVILIRELSLFPVGISCLPHVRPAKQMNACGSLLVDFPFAIISVWDDLR